MSERGLFTLIQDAAGRAASVLGWRRRATDSKAAGFVVPTMPAADVAYLVTSATLLTNGTYTQEAISCLEDVVVTRVRGLVYTDQPGTLYIEDSADGTIWNVRSTVPAVVGKRTNSGWVNLAADALYYRFRYVNGASPQAVFRLYQAAAGADNAYDPADDMLKMKSVQKKFRDSFPGPGLDLTKWDVLTNVGGMTVTVSGGTLVIGAGTTSNAEYSILSKETFTVPFRCTMGLLLSQRIANQDFYVEMVSVDPVTGLPDGKNLVGWDFNGATATTNITRVQNSGSTIVTDSRTSMTSTAAETVFELEPFSDESWFHQRAINSTAGRSFSYVKHRDIPDPTTVYKIRIRVLNGGSAPATNTNLTMSFIQCIDYAELTTEITGSRGATAAGMAMPVAVSSVPTTGVVGPAAHDAVISGAPVRMGGRAVTANYSAVATGDVADLITTLVGALITKPYSIPDLDWQYAPAGAITNTSDVAAKTAAGAGIRNYVTNLTVQNTNATATEFVIKDGASVIFRVWLPANMATPVPIPFPTPLKGTANTVTNIACITTGASVYANLQGYAAP